jgi:hypothetical protein
VNSIRATHAALFLLAVSAAPAAAQHCDTGHTGWTARVMNGVRSAEHGGAANWTTSAALAFAPNARVGVHARYTHQHGGGRAVLLRTGSVETSLAPALPLAPCIAIGAFFSAARNAAANDHYRSVAIPLAFGRGAAIMAGATRLYFSAAGMLIYAANDARLFSFDLADTGFGWGGAARGQVDFRRITIALDLRSVMLPASVRPNGLGAHTVELSTGLRF